MIMTVMIPSFSLVNFLWLKSRNHTDLTQTQGKMCYKNTNVVCVKKIGTEKGQVSGTKSSPYHSSAFFSQKTWLFSASPSIYRIKLPFRSQSIHRFSCSLASATPKRIRVAQLDSGMQPAVRSVDQASGLCDANRTAGKLTPWWAVWGWHFSEEKWSMSWTETPKSINCCA